MTPDRTPAGITRAFRLSHPIRFTGTFETTAPCACCRPTVRFSRARSAAERVGWNRVLDGARKYILWRQLTCEVV
jgi:hypothetical protein